MAIKKIVLPTRLLAFLFCLILVSLPIFGNLDPLAAPLAGPGLMIPDVIAAEPGSTVVVPVTFTADGSQIASLTFSIDYDQEYLSFDPGFPNAVVMHLPDGLGFDGNCTFSAEDIDGELDCYVLDFVEPLDALPDGIFLELTLQTGTPESGVIAAVNFSASPSPAFENTDGQDVTAGLIENGSVLIGQIEEYAYRWLPLIAKAIPIIPPTHTPTPTATVPVPTFTPTVIPCKELILNGGFELVGKSWEIPNTVYPAAWSQAKAHSGLWSMRTGIVIHDDDILSYSSARQDVTIPASSSSATLGFWIYTLSEEATLNYLESMLQPLGPFPDDHTLANDLQYMLVLEGDEYQLLWYDLRDARAWEYRTVSLKSYIGHSISVNFGTYNDGWDGVTAMYVDDVTLTVCP